MAICGIARAARILLIAEAPDNNRIVERAHATCIQRLHVEDIDILHLTQDLESIQARGLLEVGRDGARSGAGREEILFRGDLGEGLHGWGCDSGDGLRRVG